MKKGAGAGIILIVSIILLIVALSYYFVFVIGLRRDVAEIKTQEEIENELDINLINFVKLKYFFTGCLKKLPPVINLNSILFFFKVLNIFFFKNLNFGFKTNVKAKHEFSPINF